MNKEKTFVYHDEKKLGQLYILGKVQSGSQEEQSYLVNLVASIIRREYYDYPDRKPLDALKASLSKANIILERFDKEVAFICAVLYRGRLYLAQTKNDYFTSINKAKFETVKNTKSTAVSVPLFQEESKHFWARLQRYAKHCGQANLPRLKINNFEKALIGLYLVFVLIISSAVYFSQKQVKKQEIIGYQKVFSQAKQRFLQAEAVLMFNQNDRAKILLEESSNLLSSLPDSPDKAGLAQEIKTELDKSNKLFEINNLKIIKLDQPANGLVKIQKYVYVFNSENNAIYQIHATVKPISTASINLGYLQKSTVFESEDAIVFLTDTPGLAIYTLNKTLEKIQASMPLALVKDISSYNQYVYFLTENQIYKYYRTLAGFSGPTAWLKQKTEFINPVSLAVDGNIYILDNNQVLRFFRGIRQEFNLNFELEQPIKVFTLVDLNYLYLLEKDKLLVFDKTGQLMSQYVSSKFSDLKDIWVDKDKTIYLLNNQEVLEFETE